MTLSTTSRIAALAKPQAQRGVVVSSGDNGAVVRVGAALVRSTAGGLLPGRAVTLIDGQVYTALPQGPRYSV